MKPYYQDSAVQIFHGDCREIVPTLGRFDLLLTDPPYGIGLNYGWAGDYSSKAFGASDWDILDGDTVLRMLSAAPYSIIWGGNYFPLPPMRGWLVWDKMQKHSGSEAEFAWSNINVPAKVFRMCRAVAYSTMDKEHPTQKPVELMTWCLGFAPDAQTVLDPFAGSGTTGRACKDLGRKCVMIEREEKYCEIAARRMGQEVLNLGVA